jgi:hypothetical protein
MKQTSVQDSSNIATIPARTIMCGKRPIGKSALMTDLLKRSSLFGSVAVCAVISPILPRTSDTIMSDYPIPDQRKD